MSKRIEFRCFCRYSTLLGVGYIQSDGSPMLHIKTMRSGRVTTEVKIVGGVAWVRCRDCLRFHKISVQRKFQQSGEKNNEG